MPPNKQDFEMKLNLTCQGQSTHKVVGILTKVFCISGPHLVILAWIVGKLLYGQKQNGINLDLDFLIFDIDSRGQLPRKI